MGMGTCIAQHVLTAADDSNPFWRILEKAVKDARDKTSKPEIFPASTDARYFWKAGEPAFGVFTIAAADERKNIVLLAFETMEKIVREYFSYITETEATTFTDCVRCLITFTNKGGLVWNEKGRSSSPGTPVTDDHTPTSQNFMEADENISYWVPLLIGLSKLTSDSRSAIHKSSLEVLFNILNDHGHLFSRTFWMGSSSPSTFSPRPNEASWDAETSAMAAQSLVDLFVSFFTVIRSQLSSVVSLLAGLIRSPAQGPTVAGVGALLWLADELGGSFSEDEWKEIFLAVKEAASLTLSSFIKILRIVDDIPDEETLSDQDFIASCSVTDLCRIHQQSLLASHVTVILDILSSLSSHAHQLNSDLILQKKLRRACSILELSEPPMLHFENDTHQNYLDVLQDLLTYNPGVSLELNIESELITVCVKILKVYLKCTLFQGGAELEETRQPKNWILPMGTASKEEAAARSPLVVTVLKTLRGLERDSFKSSDNPELVAFMMKNGNMPACPPEDPTVKMLYVKRLSRTTLVEEDLRDCLSVYGDIESIRMVQEYNGAAFITYGTREAVEKCMEDLKTWVEIKGHKLKILWVYKYQPHRYTTISSNQQGAVTSTQEGASSSSSALEVKRRKIE
ncbi:unnamed protein product [Arabidopsis lyrata]|nr:unnamed protein product [Arabidopsis lyrata]